MIQRIRSILKDKPTKIRPESKPSCEGWSGRMDEHSEYPGCAGCNE